MLTCALHPNLFCLPDNKTLPYHLRQYLYWWRCINVLLILSIMWAVHLLDKPGSLHKRACVTIKVRNERLTVLGMFVCVSCQSEVSCCLETAENDIRIPLAVTVDVLEKSDLSRWVNSFQYPSVFLCDYCFTTLALLVGWQEKCLALKKTCSSSHEKLFLT